MLRSDPRLCGFKIPGEVERILVALFADDTTVYLSENDKYCDLLDVLETWCKASRARFNKNKTEIIPIGTKEYRDKVRRTRSLNGTEADIPEDVEILKDGQATRLLGAWVGNGIDQAAVWTDTVRKVDKELRRWHTAKPTLHAKALVVQMTVGGLTQYKTRVQGMPNSIQEELNKSIRKFIWGEGRGSPIAMAELQR
ncbi:hypothetical protein PUNSTDRAFT_69375, partial [Punctularia strigosozonata HHB-11173 SS5]|uniref:uncharacterized protein n=1 Tax=Punctularia strigosozonata (strain HHB-11173) TaxID=741275 RepID=UPI0004417315